MTKNFLLVALLSIAPLFAHSALKAPVKAPAPPPSPSKYFVIQNIATEKTRVYERCTATPDCPHKMIFETDTVVGRPEEGTSADRYAFITWLGHSRIQSWVKFYSDRAQTYPSWYTAGQDIKTIPTPISDSGSKMGGAKKWTIKTPNGGTTMYGAFGWYAAMLSPADAATGVNFQWMHGTIGWGKDEALAIEVTRGALINMFSNPGSHGCTRLDNLSIALLRYLLEPGTDIYRVYAREATREKEEVSGVFNKKVTAPLPRYADVYNKPGSWDYILLTDGAQKSNGLTADAATVRASGIPIVPGQNFLEEGTFLYNRYPKAAYSDYTRSASSGKTGDRYEIDNGMNNSTSNFRGYFLVDEGRLMDYQHPNPNIVGGKIRVGGLSDFRDAVPAELVANPGPYYPGEIKYRGGR